MRGSYLPSQPRNLVIIEAGTAESGSPVNILRSADRALRRGLAEPDLEGGTTIAISLILLAMETARAVGGWGHPVVDIQAAMLQLKRSALEIAKVARGRAAVISRELIKAADETLQNLGDDDVR